MYSCPYPAAFVTQINFTDTDFVALDRNNGSWNVVSIRFLGMLAGWKKYLQVRAEFDDVMLKHAAKSGAIVIEETKVTELQFVGERPVSATWVSRGGIEGQIAFDYLVDASGRNGVVSTKYLHNRRFNKNLNNVACWGYWEGAGSYRPGTTRENAIWVEALPGQSIICTKCPEADFECGQMSLDGHGLYRFTMALPPLEL